MPIFSVTTTAIDIIGGDGNLETITFRNGSTAGIVYLRNRRLDNTEVASTSYEFSLGPADAVSFSYSIDGVSMRGPWRAVSDTAGGVTLEVLPGYKQDRRI